MHCKSYLHFFSKKFQHICVSLDVNFNESLTNDIVSFEQLGPGFGLPIFDRVVCQLLNSSRVLLVHVFVVYCEKLTPCNFSGWTGERVCFTGDSAGANLAMSTALRAVSFEIRVPDGIVLTYACLLVQYSPSPARFMSMIDPLLPVGILMRCLAGLLNDPTQTLFI